ncbi:MAG: hypothetical protein WCC39_17855 [Telluria sp.]
METTLHTRKPAEALTPEDLDMYTVWEMAREDGDDRQQDATWIRPLDRSTIPRETGALSVAADFITADGTRFAGMVGLSTAAGVAIASASLLVDGACVYAAHGEKTSIRYKTSTASQLGKSPADIYPLRFTLRALLEGEAAPRSGIFA